MRRATRVRSSISHGVTVALLLAWALAGRAPTLSGAQGAAPRAAPAPACVERYDPGVDYFPEKATVEDAVNFSVSYHRSYKVVTVRSSAAAPPERYVLVQCGTPAPPRDGELARAQVVTVPIRSLYSASTTHLPLLVDLERLDVLAGVATKKHLIGDAIVAHAAGSSVREFAPASTIDTELVLSQRPSLLMTGGSSSAELSVIRRGGVPVVANHEWLEPTALARGEWLKYMALFLNEERAASEQYRAVKTRYRDLSARAMAVPDDRKPRVMTGRASRGEFVVAGGRSYVAALIRDAGGRYLWSDDTSTSSITVDIEAQLRRSGQADIWINGGGWDNREAMLRDEPRYRLFKAFQSGEVWVYERAVNAAGANDYWSRAVSHPDLILADLVKIFHPSLASGHEFQWYLRVPAR